MSRKRGLLAALALLALAAGVVSVRDVSDQVAVLGACEAAERGEWGDVLARTAGRTGPGETGLAAAECRCRALLATGAGDACLALLEPLLASAEVAGWAPGPELSVHVIQTWRETGRTAEAAALARRAGGLHPGDPDLFYLELATRGSVEDEEAVLAELAARIPAEGPAAARMRVSLAHRRLQRGEAMAALAALGEAPPVGAGEATSRWYETRGIALATAGDGPGVARSYAAWRAAGGEPDELLARYALTLSVAGLVPSGETMLSLLRRGLAAADDSGDAKVHEALAIRLVLTLANSGEHAEALAVYDRARGRFALAGLSRDELERSAIHRALAREGAASLRGRVRFSVLAPAPGLRLALSPAADESPDARWQERALPASGELDIERTLDEAPLRWVLRDARSRTLASGTTHLLPGDLRHVAIEPRTARERAVHISSRRPADGRRRVAALVLDCADWRIASYLIARGELPVLERLLAGGFRAVLRSDPPLTAAALESLVFPLREGNRSFVGLLHQMGGELAGLASVGENPLGALAWLLREEADLFSVLGHGPHSAANLLFSHGGIHAGRHGLVTGPDGRERRVPMGATSRDLDAAERERFPLLAAVLAERDRVHLRTIAAEMDAARDLARAGEIDLVFLRIEPLDILTHAHFAEAVRGGQDDGARLLFEVYRYLDARVAEVEAALDADDVLVVMSDHGIRTAMEHSPQALFVATGAGVPAGRAAGDPDLRGVPRALADLMGVETPWPDAGVAPWASALARTGAPREPAELSRENGAPATKGKNPGGRARRAS